MHILTTAELLTSSGKIQDRDYLVLLNELRRFLSDESTGVKGFDRMPKEWGDLNKLVSNGGVNPARSIEAQIVVEAWHQETRDLSLILSRMTEERVEEKLPRKHINAPVQRQKDELVDLRENQSLSCQFQIPVAAAPLEARADINRRTVELGMTLRAPEDKKRTKARLNRLLRQIKTKKAGDVFVRLLWPVASEPTQYQLSELREDPDQRNSGKEHLTAHGFHVFLSRRLEARFTQQSNFIADLESIVPNFYGDIGSSLVAWKKSAPRFKQTKATAEDVTPEAISEDAADFDP